MASGAWHYMRAETLLLQADALRARLVKEGEGGAFPAVEDLLLSLMAVLDTVIGQAQGHAALALAAATAPAQSAACSAQWALALASAPGEPVTP